MTTAEKKKMTDDEIIARAKEHQGALQGYIDKWVEIGVSTERANRPSAENGVMLAYQLNGLVPPKLAIWTKSHYDAVRIRAELLINGRSELFATTKTPEVGRREFAVISDKEGDMEVELVVLDLDGYKNFIIGGEASESKREQLIRDGAWNALYGNHDAGWMPFYDFFANECDMADLVQEQLGHLEVAKHGCWWWPHDTVVFMADRPSVVKYDEQYRLHCADGPAIVWDQWCVWFWHNVRVPQRVIETPELLTVDEIEREANAEVRRIMVERFGYERYMRESGPRLVSEDKYGKLWLKDQPDGEPPIVMVEVLNSTPEPDGSVKTYFLMCHHELRPIIGMRGAGENQTFELGEPQKLTAHNAVAASFGLTGELYSPLVET